MRVHWSLIVAALAMGCTPMENDDGSESTDVPDEVFDTTDLGEETEAPDTGDGFDTGGNGFTNDVPTDTLYLEQSGLWLLGPSGGPYDTVSGEFLILETVNLSTDDWQAMEESNELDPDSGVTDQLAEAEWCRVVYDITGTESEEDYGCPSCTVVFEVEFTVVEGDPGACADPDAPFDGETRWLGWDNPGNRVLYNYHGIGQWEEWFAVEKTDDELEALWQGTLAIDLPEEEEE